LTITNRTAANLDSLLAVLAPIAGRIPVKGLLAESKDNVPANAIVINATSAGLRDTDAAPIDLRRLPKPAGVYDMIYNPPQTALLRAAAALGVPRANGLSMLVHQGARALSIWSDADVPVPVMSLAARNALGA
jgi:shikimate dehydrogenase